MFSKPSRLAAASVTTPPERSARMCSIVWATPFASPRRRATVSPGTLPPVVKAPLGRRPAEAADDQVWMAEAPPCPTGIGSYDDYAKTARPLDTQYPHVQAASPVFPRRRRGHRPALLGPVNVAPAFSGPFGPFQRACSNCHLGQVRVVVFSPGGLTILHAAPKRRPLRHDSERISRGSLPARHEACPHLGSPDNQKCGTERDGLDGNHRLIQRPIRPPRPAILPSPALALGPRPEPATPGRGE